MERRKERIDRGIYVRSKDIFVLNSWKEMVYFAGPRALPVVGLLVFSLALDMYWQKTLILAASYALLALSWDLLNIAGMISLGQALFFGVGSYCTALFNHYVGCPIYLSLPLGTLLGAVLCTIFLIPVLRLRGIYFAMVTLVVPMMLVRLIETTRIFGGTEGLSGLDPFPNTWVELTVICLILLIAFFGLRRLMGSDYGLVLKGIGNNDRLVMSGGVNIYWFKIQAVFIASVIGCFSGAFMTHAYMFVGMPAFALDYSMVPITAVMVGGRGSFAGAILGSFLLIPMSEILRSLGALRIVFYSFLLVVFILVLPEGIFHYVARKYQQFERWVTGKDEQ